MFANPQPTCTTMTNSIHNSDYMNDDQLDAWLNEQEDLQEDNVTDNTYAEFEASGALRFLDADPVQSPPKVIDPDLPSVESNADQHAQMAPALMTWAERDRQKREQTVKQLAREMALMQFQAKAFREPALASQPADSPAARGPPVVPENTSQAARAAAAAEARAEAFKKRGTQPGNQDKQ